MGDGSFGKGGETFFDGDEGGHFVVVLRDGGSAGGAGQLIGGFVQHLSVSGAGCFMTKVSVFGTVNVHDMLPLVGLEDLKLVHHIGERMEERSEVKVRDLRSLSFSMEFGALATQFG